tara:strand:+ start:35 stop:238 length:204 start_codon:yes stop_codon:yes gene_type:complete
MNTAESATGGGEEEEEKSILCLLLLSLRFLVEIECRSQFFCKEEKRRGNFSSVFATKKTKEKKERII